MCSKQKQTEEVTEWINTFRGRGRGCGYWTNPGERLDKWGPWQTFCLQTVSPSCVCVCERAVYLCVSMRGLEQGAGGTMHISGTQWYAKLCWWI